MKAHLRSITGIDDAIISMFISKHTLTPELEKEINDVIFVVSDRNGFLKEDASHFPVQYKKYVNWMDKLAKWGKRHITMLRFVDMSFMVYGLHRAGQDDWDAHACRFSNRIIRNSSRFAGIKDQSHLQNMSDYYSDKVLTTDAVLELLKKDMPQEIEHDGKTYVRAFNGYIVKGLEENQDVKRGLYNLGFPSDYIFRCNLCEFAHVYKERGAHGGANPEVKQLAEMLADQIEEAHPMFNRKLLMSINN